MHSEDLVNNRHEIHINRRIFLRDELNIDSSIQELGFACLNDWGLVKQWRQGIRRMPITKAQKQYLDNIVFSGMHCGLYVVHNPTVLIYRWPSGEERWFMVTQHGNLVEPHDYSVWDSFLPFATKSNGIIHFSMNNIISLERDTLKQSLVWAPFSNNYTHFLIDSYAPLITTATRSWVKSPSDYKIFSFQAYDSWQEKLLANLPYGHIIYNQPLNPLSPRSVVLKPSRVIYPVLSGRPVAIHLLRLMMHKAFGISPFCSFSYQPSSRVVLLTRHDLRRKRIRNIKHIESIVLEKGGIVVDPASLSFGDKVNVLKEASLCIAEGSSSLNHALFSPDRCHLLNLTDPSILAKAEFTVGGWPYHIYNAWRTSFLIGDHPLPLANSPLGSADYDIDFITNLIDATC